MGGKLRKALKFLKNNIGFSLVETIIIVAIFSFVFVLSSQIFFSYHKKQTLNQAAKQTESLLNEARFYTFYSKDGSQYGVHFEVNRAVFFKGNVFTEPNSNNKELLLPSNVEIYNVSLNGGGADAVFELLTGKTNKYGAVSFRLKNEPSNIKVLNIRESGITDIN